MKKRFLILSLPLALGAFSPGLFSAEDAPQPEAAEQSAAPAGATAPNAPAEVAEPAEPAKPAKPAKPKRTRGRSNSGNAVVTFFSDAIVPAGKKVDAAVAMFGDARVDGGAREAVAMAGSVTANANVRQAVSIVGSTTVNDGAREAVAVIGNVYVNSHVTGRVVAVGGGVVLGPGARVDGQVVALGGGIRSHETASIGGEIVEFKLFNNINGFNAWLSTALAKGRLLAFDSGLAWAWVVAGVFLLLYVLTALVVPGAVAAGAITLEEQPGWTLLAALLTAIFAPIVWLLLAATGVGLIVLFLAKVALSLAGNAAFLAWMGRRARIAHPALAVFAGGVALALLYCVPVLGILMWKLSGFLGAGMVVYAVVLALRRRRDEREAARREKVAASFAPEGALITREAAVALASRAGFWIRAAALLIDFAMIFVAAHMCQAGFLTLPLFAIYCIVMWRLRGTTVGGIVCGLKIVRADGRPLDWATAIVRALGGFVAMAFLGFGFIWVAIDADSQGWHDKIAGTAVVNAPKGESLV